MQNWWYAKGGERRGPITVEQLRELISSGQVQPSDLAWTQGMAQWQPVGQVPALRASPAGAMAAPSRPARNIPPQYPAPAAAAPRPQAAAAASPAPAAAAMAPAAQPSQRTVVTNQPIPSTYVLPAATEPIAEPTFADERAAAASRAAPEPVRPEIEQLLLAQPTTAPDSDSGLHPGEETDLEVDAHESAPVQVNDFVQLPRRAQANLRGHALPLGDAGAWPISDVRFGMLMETMKIRKRISAATQIYRGLMALAILGAALAAFASIVTIVGRGNKSKGETVAMVILFCLMAFMSAAYWVAARFTSRSHRWAPLVMFILFFLGLSLNLALAALVLPRPKDSEAISMIAGNAVGAIFCLAFAVVSLRAFLAIPKYLQQPAWCQEIIAAAGL